MSANLCWRPVVKPPHKTLPDDLKFILMKSWDVNTELTTVNASSVGYLQGLADAGIAGAQELIDVVCKHGCVEIWLE